MAYNVSLTQFTKNDIFFTCMVGRSDSSAGVAHWFHLVFETFPPKVSFGAQHMFSLHSLAASLHSLIIGDIEGFFKNECRQ